MTALFSGNRANFIRQLNMRRESGTVAVNVDEIFYRWDVFKNKRVENLDEKSCIEFQKKILRVTYYLSYKNRLSNQFIV